MSGSRLLIVGNFLSASIGTRWVCEDLAEQLTKAGWVVLTTSDKPGKVLRLFDMLSTAWRRRKDYDIAQVDVYSGPSFLWAEAVCWLLKRLKKPFILTLHGGKLPEFAQRWPRRVKRLFNAAAAITTPSHYVQQNLQSIHDPIHVIPNPLDLGQYPYRLRSRPTPNLVWLRAFTKGYRPADAVETVALLKDEFPDIRLTMIGPDKGDGSWQSTQDTIHRLGLADHVDMPGAIPKASVPETLMQYDVFLNTTTAESFGVSVVEAAAVGLCIVTTNVGELSYLWKNGYDVLLVPPGTPQAMAVAVRQILTQPDLAQQLSTHARATAEQFDRSNILPKWDSLLQTLATGEQHEQRD